MLPSKKSEDIADNKKRSLFILLNKQIKQYDKEIDILKNDSKELTALIQVLKKERDEVSSMFKEKKTKINFVNSLKTELQRKKATIVQKERFKENLKELSKDICKDKDEQFKKEIDLLDLRKNVEYDISIRSNEERKEKYEKEIRVKRSELKKLVKEIRNIRARLRGIIQEKEKKEEEREEKIKSVELRQKLKKELATKMSDIERYFSKKSVSSKEISLLRTEVEKNLKEDFKKEDLVDIVKKHERMDKNLHNKKESIVGGNSGEYSRIVSRKLEPVDWLLHETKKRVERLYQEFEDILRTVKNLKEMIDNPSIKKIFPDKSLFNQIRKANDDHMERKNKFAANCKAIRKIHFDLDKKIATIQQEFIPIQSGDEKVLDDVIRSKLLVTYMLGDEKTERILNALEKECPEILRTFKGVLGESQISMKKTCKGLGRIISNPRNSLEELDLSGCNIDDETLMILLSSITNSGNMRLRKLNISNNLLKKEKTFESLGKLVRESTTLTHLFFEKNQNSGRGASILLRSLIQNSNSRICDISFSVCEDYRYNEPISSFNFSLDPGLENESIKTIKILFNLGDDTNSRSSIGVSHLSEMLSRCKSLEKLNLKDSRIGDRDFKILISGIVSLENISYIELEDNKDLTIESLKMIKDSEFSSETWMVGISFCDFGERHDEFLDYICPPFRVDTRGLRGLNLSSKHKERLRKFLTEYSKFARENWETMKASEKSLTLHDNLFSNESNELGMILGNKYFRRVGLGWNELIGNSGAQKLTETLKKGDDTVQFLDIRGIGIDDNLDSSFWDAIFSMKKLETLLFGDDKLGITAITSFVEAFLSSYGRYKGKTWKLKDIRFHSSASTDSRVIEKLSSIFGVGNGRDKFVFVIIEPHESLCKFVFENILVKLDNVSICKFIHCKTKIGKDAFKKLLMVLKNGIDEHRIIKTKVMIEPISFDCVDEEMIRLVSWRYEEILKSIVFTENSDELKNDLKSRFQNTPIKSISMKDRPISEFRKVFSKLAAQPKSYFVKMESIDVSGVELERSDVELLCRVKRKCPQLVCFYASHCGLNPFHLKKLGILGNEDFESANMSNQEIEEEEEGENDDDDDEDDGE